jgi:hypothetical protein
MIHGTSVAARGAVWSILRRIALLVLVASIGLVRPALADNAQYYYDPDGRLVGMVDPVNGSAYYNYDATGNILSVSVNPITAVSVVGFDPPTGGVGATITIGGTGFDTASDTSVSFNGVAASPSAVTANSITVAVPAGATTGPVTVTAPAGSATSVASFIVTNVTAPQIASFSPGVVAPGGTLTITGSNFDPVNSKVVLNGRLITILSASATTITAMVPTVGSGRLTVETPAGSATAMADVIVAPPGYAATALSSSQRVSFPAVGAGQSVTASVASSGQVALILFDASSGQAASVVEAASAPNNCCSLALYGPDGALVSSTASIDGGANAFLRAQALARSGTYSLAITNASATLTLYDVPTVPIGGPLTAAGAAVTAALAVPGEVPTFTFSGTAGQAINVLTQPAASFVSPGLDHTVRIIEPDGQTTLYSNQNVTNYNLTGVLTLPVSGTYTVQFVPAAAVTGNVAVQLQTPFSGTLTAGGAAISNSLAAEPGDVISLSFAGTAGQAVDFVTQPDSSFTSFSFSNTVTITEPDGQTQLYANRNVTIYNLTGQLILPVTGTYTLQFIPGAPVGGNVSIQLDTPITDTLTAGAGAVSNSLSSEPGDAISLTFAGTAGQQVELVTQPDSSFTSFSFSNTVTITEPDGQTQLYANHNVTGSNLTGLMTLPTTGTYTAQFSPGAPVGGSVSMLLESPITGTLTPDGAAIVSDLTNEPGDIIQLSFAGTTGQAVELVTQPSSSFSSFSFSNTITITEPDGQTQLYANRNVTGTTLTGILILPTTGTYVASFLPGSFVGGTVSMQLDTPQSGMLTLGGASVTVSDQATPGDAVSIPFLGTAGQQVRLVTQPDGSFSSFYFSNTVRIIEPDGQTLLYSNNNVTSYNLTGILTLPTTGTYTAQFIPGGAASGNVTMSLDQPIATSIAIAGPPVASSVTQPGDVIALSFTGMAGQQVELVTQPDSNFSSFYFSNTVAIIEPDGQTLLYSNANVTAFNLTGVLTLPASGTYTAEFIPGGPVTGDVTMQLNAPITDTIGIGGPSDTESVTAPGDSVLVSFTGAAGQAVELVTTPSSGFSSFYFSNSVAIIEPDGQTRLYSNGNLGGGSSYLSGTLTLPSNGTYTILFQPGGPVSGTIGFTLYDAGTNANGAQDFTASIPTAGATAQLAFSDTSGSRVSLLTQADSTLDQACFTISLTPPGTATPLYNSTQSSATDFSQALTLPSSGLYTMLLASCGSATGNAALTLYSVPANAGGGATIGGSAVSLTTTAPGQDVQITFPTSSFGQTANIAVTADSSFSSACYNVTIADPGGNQVNTGQGCGTSYATGDLTLGAAGTYTILVASVSTATGNVTVGVTAQ